MRDNNQPRSTAKSYKKPNNFAWCDGKWVFASVEQWKKTIWLWAEVDSSSPSLSHSCLTINAADCLCKLSFLMGKRFFSPKSSGTIWKSQMRESQSHKNESLLSSAADYFYSLFSLKKKPLTKWFYPDAFSHSVFFNVEVKCRIGFSWKLKQA